jgi:arylsulfatase A
MPNQPAPQVPPFGQVTRRPHPAAAGLRGRRAPLAAAVVLVPLLCALGVPLRAQDARRPNVVVILVDDMGYGDIGPYGVEDIRTPHLDRLAREGVRFTDFYANGAVCTPTRAALMTGRYQQRVGLEWAILLTEKEPGLPATEPTLPRLLRENGYRTGMVGKWHLGFRPEHGPNAHGFQEFFGILSGNVDMYSHRYRTGERDLWENDRPVEQSGYLTDLLTDRAVSFLEKSAADPFFLYVAYNAVHWPFQVPGRPDDVRTERTWYDGTRADYARMLESMDAGVGRILDALDRLDLARNTLVIFTNDNGGERLSRSAPLFHHKATLWEGGIRVPCLLRWPGKVGAGTVSNQIGATFDLTATILAATRTAPPSKRPLDGVDLLPRLTAPAAGGRPLFWRIDRPDRRQRAVRLGQWKYVRDGAIDLLFDLSADPGERNDRGYDEPARLADLRARLARWEQDVDASALEFPMNLGSGGVIRPKPGGSR